MASFGLVILLLAEYVLGIAYNLYGTAPTATTGVTFFSSLLLGAHVVLGALLLVASISMVVISIRAGEAVATIGSMVGGISILAAAVSGSAFAQDGANGYSMAMSVLAAVAILSYATIVTTLSLRSTGAAGAATSGTGEAFPEGSFTRPSEAQHATHEHCSKVLQHSVTGDHAAIAHQS